MTAPDIFLSYNREDAGVVKRYADAFAAEGVASPELLRLAATPAMTRCRCRAKQGGHERGESRR